MKIKLLATFLFLGLYAIFTNVNAQQVLVRIEKPFVANSLSGIVTDKNDSEMPGVTVERLTPEWKKEIDSVKMNYKGKFCFKDLPPGTYYLRFSANGFNQLEVKVELKKHAKKKLRFKLEIST